jgi:hypothetical protein
VEAVVLGERHGRDHRGERGRRRGVWWRGSVGSARRPPPPRTRGFVGAAASSSSFSVMLP